MQLQIMLWLHYLFGCDIESGHFVPICVPVLQMWDWIFRLWCDFKGGIDTLINPVCKLYARWEKRREKDFRVSAFIKMIESFSRNF